MPKKKSISTGKIKNRRASFDYELDDSLTVGIQLSGAETKSLRRGHGHLRGAYVTLKKGELWLINATITGDSGISLDESEQTRSRKLLAKRKEINKLVEAKQQGRTIVPIELLTKGRYVKLRIAPGKGKREYDKRQTIKAREADRKAKSYLN